MNHFLFYVWIFQSKLEKSVAGNGIGAAMKNKWIRIDAGKYVADASKADEVRADAVAQLLRGDLDALDKPQQTLLKKRKLLKLTYYCFSIRFRHYYFFQ